MRAIHHSDQPPAIAGTLPVTSSLAEFASCDVSGWWGDTVYRAADARFSSRSAGGLPERESVRMRGSEQSSDTYAGGMALQVTSAKSSTEPCE